MATEIQWRADALPATTATSDIFEERESAVRSYCRAFPAVFTSAKGAIVSAADGREYIDFLAGAGALNYGHNPASLKAALLEYIVEDGMTHGLDLHTAAKQAFLEEFTTRALAPRGLDHKVQFVGPTGANAVEAALKVVRKATGRSGIFAFMGGYHGHSLGSLAATANRTHRAAAGAPLGGVTFMPFPGGPTGSMDTLAFMRACLEDTHSGIELPAAVIVETVQAEGGIGVAPADWLRGLSELCADHGILLIVDEIQTGCGRTGPFFSFERAGIVPDVITVSKSVSGYGLPMALTLMRPGLDLWTPGEHTGTFRGNQLAFVTASAALRLFDDEAFQRQRAENSRTIEQWLHECVASLDPRIEIRGLGMIWGVDTGVLDPSGKLAGAISRRCFADGLILERVGRNDTVLKLLPPLNIDDEALARGLAILADATAACLDGDTPAPAPALIEHLREVRAAEAVSFHMPGHKGGTGAPALGLEVLGHAAYEADVSELAGFDYLHGPRSALAEAQAQAAALMGAARSWFLVNGATVGNVAAICAAVGDGDGLLMQRASHRSVYAGLWASGAEPVYLAPVGNRALDGLFGLDPADVDAALSANPGIRAVHITNPSMFGLAVPVAEIAAIVAAHGLPLIVDEAHGTHFALHSRCPSPALACGADVVIHSPHKALGALTQAALLHHQGERVDRSLIDRALGMLQSSSPSAPLLLSLAASIDEMARHGQERWGRAIEIADQIKNEVKRPLVAYSQEIVGTPGIAGLDPAKVVVDTEGLSLTGYAANRWLRANRNINAETADLRRLAFSITMADDDASAEALIEALAALSRQVAARGEQTDIVSLWPASIPERAVTPRAAAGAATEAVAIREAVGRVAAEMVIPYPPGVPLLVEGEVVSADAAESVLQLLDVGCRVVGMSDPAGATLRCFERTPASRLPRPWPGGARRRRVDPRTGFPIRSKAHTGEAARP